ncbi:MAG: AraC family transcriptional regulator ligand-binding domain-containing protein [Rhodobacteraceae bacterium]|nr:AraC family transcriptional regulator ligand-binding domain-containing protein [Paracoccaceae bacterium]
MTDLESPYRQRATLLTHLPPLLAEFGVSLAPVLEGTGVSADQLVPGAYIPYAGMLMILDRAAALSGRDDLGVLLGERQTLASLGPAGQVMTLAATVGEALNDYSQFHMWNSTGAAAYVYRTPLDVVFGYGIYDPAGPGAVQIHNLVLAAGCMLLLKLTGKKVQPVEIWSMGPRPSKPALLECLAGCPVRYRQDRSCIFLPLTEVDAPLPRADRTAHAAALAQLAARTAPGPWGMAARVRHALRASIVSGRSDMPEIAVRLQLHPRTLRRALEREGTTFAALRDEVLHTVARELLSLTTLHVSDIALALNYAHTGAFSNAFRRWSGTTPSEWRRLHAVGLPR